ncbi:hypothetical protein BB559_005102 [Furculomyces boomerangus]|uniref:Uncharacterized protein n=1 Tax=Furculomyces boomerangus TaxID=61424 RepID=A0A2T9YAR4_9FUNG|nr:hypothetical protein BB559_005102 [Furculomyces boomerangus]
MIHNPNTPDPPKKHRSTFSSLFSPATIRSKAGKLKSIVKDLRRPSSSAKSDFQLLSFKYLSNHPLDHQKIPESPPYPSSSSHASRPQSLSIASNYSHTKIYHSNDKSNVSIFIESTPSRSRPHSHQAHRKSNPYHSSSIKSSPINPVPQKPKSLYSDNRFNFSQKFNSETPQPDNFFDCTIDSTQIFKSKTIEFPRTLASPTNTKHYSYTNLSRTNSYTKYMTSPNIKPSFNRTSTNISTRKHSHLINDFSQNTSIETSSISSKTQSKYSTPVSTQERSVYQTSPPMYIAAAEDSNSFNSQTRNSISSTKHYEIGSPDPNIDQLEKSMYYSRYALSLFLNSRFSEAEKLLCSKSINDDMYSAVGLASILLIKAAVSFDRNTLKEAYEASSNLVQIASQFKKSNQPQASSEPSNQNTQGKSRYYKAATGSMIGWLKSGASKVASMAMYKRPIDICLEISEMEPLQRHAELIFAEGYLLRAIANVILNGGLIAFLKEGWNIRTAYSIYKNCYTFIKWCNKQDSQEAISALETLDDEFVNGVYFGVGIFNIVLSMLPQKLLKVVEFIGFSSDYKLGLSLLVDATNIDKNKLFTPFKLTRLQSNTSLSSIESFETAPEILIKNISTSPTPQKTESSSIINSDYLYTINLEKSNTSSGNTQTNAPAKLKSMRAELSALALAGYHTVLCPETGNMNFDLDFAQALISEKQKDSPNSIVLLYFNGKISELRCDLESAIISYSKILKVPIDPGSNWSKMRHIGLWQEGLCNMALGDWKSAFESFGILIKESNWSKAVYTYCSAICLYEQFLESKNEDLLTKTKDLLSVLPNMKMKIAGKSLPIEKFVLRKARKFSLQNSFLLQPGLELLLVLNFFSKIPKYRLTQILNKVNLELSDNLASKTPISHNPITNVDKNTGESSLVSEEKEKYIDPNQVDNRIPIELLAYCWASSSDGINTNGKVPTVKPYSLTSQESQTKNIEYVHTNYQDDLALLLLLRGIIYYNFAFPLSTTKKPDSRNSTNQYAKLARISFVRLLRLTSKINYDHCYLVYGRLYLANIYMLINIPTTARMHFNSILDGSSFSKQPEIFPKKRHPRHSSSLQTQNRISLNSLEIDTRLSTIDSIDSGSYNRSVNQIEKRREIESRRWWLSRFIDHVVVEEMSEFDISNTTELYRLNGDIIDESVDLDIDNIFGWQKIKNVGSYSMHSQIETFAHNAIKTIK